MTATTRETHGFQAEVQKLLHLMVHSLYSNREIFLRELISNASDAADRLRFEALSQPALLEPDPELKVRVEYDVEARTVSVTDNGIGMSRDEVISQLGTIAKSGTGDFLTQLSGEQRRDANLIGQFGVGFYSAFIVADRVEVLTRRAGAPVEEGVRWESDGQGQFSVENIERPERGSRVTLHLREDAAEFADEFRLRTLIRKYSDHIAFPVVMAGKSDAREQKEEAANTAKALWTRPRAEISDDEYREFFKHVTHDFQDPLAWSHNRVEGKREYTSLLYVPARAPWDLWNRSGSRGLKLYVKRVFIMDDAEQFLPLYLRFVRGVVDSGDLSLNVSRELLQQDAVVEAMRSALTKRVLDLLDRLAKDEPDKYGTFWKEFGRVLKEGPAEDPANRQKIAGLLRFSTTHTDNATPDQSLADYVGRRSTCDVGDDLASQKVVWYLTADTFSAARSSPHLEVFRQRGIEVLLLTDTIDEWLVGHLGEFDGFEFRDVKRGELTAEKSATGDAENSAGAVDSKVLVDRLRSHLADQVADVRPTSRLTESPACLVIGEHEMGAQMRKLMQATGQAVPDAKPILEVNPAHPLLARLNGLEDGERFADLARLVFDQAYLADGGQLEDPGAFLQRLNRILLT